MREDTKPSIKSISRWIDSMSPISLRLNQELGLDRKTSPKGGGEAGTTSKQCKYRYALGGRETIDGEEMVRLVRCKLAADHKGFCCIYPMLSTETGVNATTLDGNS